MDGIADVQARIAQIQSRIASVTSSAPGVPAGGRPGFSAALDQALAATSAQPGTTSGTRATTAGLSGEDRLAALRLRHASLRAEGLTTDGAPKALAAYGNGKIPPAALESIGHGGHRLWAPAAKAFQAMHAAARDGIDIGVTNSYRSYDAQVDLAERKGLYSQGGLAAKPGTSDHGWGRALDLDLDAKAQAWMRANGDRYGFVEDTPREP